MNVLTNALALVALVIGTLYLAYKVYGGFLARRIFAFDERRITPANEFKDGIDFVPTHPSVLFGHHFASIAGLGPIIGPAIAIYWGWVPALLWIVIGCILIGGVHDMAALFASIRHKAHTIGEVTTETVGGRARWLFLLIIFFVLSLAMGVFAIEMAGLFIDLSPQAVVPTFSLIIIAMIFGVLVYKFNYNLLRATLLGIGLMILTTYLGLELPVPIYRLFITDPRVTEIIRSTDDPDLPQVHGIRATRAGLTLHYFETRAARDSSFVPLANDVKQARERGRSSWVYILLVYALCASILPVWFLLQPRDYINCFQLYIALGVLMLGFIVWHPWIHAPAWGGLPAAAGDQSPGIMPFLFITIACGAVSGFHNLVSSGTTARQIRRETDAHVIGYGAMLTEGLLAVLVLMACAAGLSRAEYETQYAHWAGLSGRALGAFLTGAGNVISQPFLPLFDSASHPSVISFSRNFMAVVVVSFAMTTLDSGTRLLRYNIEELAKGMNLRFLQNRYVASLVAVVAIGYFALIRIDGKPAGVVLWQLFGTSNQLLAVLGLMVASLMLYKMGKPVIYTLLPMFVMVAMVSCAITVKLGDFYRDWRATGEFGHLSLLVVGGILAIMGVWMLLEAFLAYRRMRRSRTAEATLTETAATVPD